jgi:hypothetical protein
VLDGEAPSDQTAPLLTITSPAEWIGEATPQVVVDYEDPAGTAPPSGVDPATFAVAVDGVDRTSLFTIGPAQASGALTPELSDGPHTLVISIRDAAGNESSEPLEFTIDTEPPAVAIASPLEGAYTRTSPQAASHRSCSMVS